MMHRRKRPRIDVAENNVSDNENLPDQVSSNTSRPGGNQSLAECLQSEESAVGIIEKVAMRNFLCHSNFSFQFGSHVNFLVGRNGSGKSAVLTGVVVALGGKANVTNRGSSLKELIQTGKSSAEVAVTLRNQGDDPYKPHIYGKSITVERQITSTGSGGYKIKNHNGKVMSTKREDLDHILDQFNIQVDNPVSILNQDTSRSFLFSKSPTDKYKFFLKATQLEQMEQDYLTAAEEKQVSNDFMSQKQEELPALEAEVHEWEQKVKALKGLDELRRKIRMLKQEMAWAFINQKEQALSQKLKELEREKSLMSKLAKKQRDAEMAVKARDESMQDSQRRTQGVTAAAEQIEPQFQAAHTEREESKKVFRKGQSTLEKLANEQRLTSSERDQLRQRIKDLRCNAVAEEEKQVRDQRIRELDAKRGELTAAMTTTEHSVQQFHAAVTKLKNDLYKLRSEESGVRRNLEAQQRRIRELEASRKDHLKRFGAHIPEVVKKINEAHKKGRFHQSPRGPIGRYLKVKDPVLSLAVEQCLASLLHAFCVTDHHDERELDRILSETVRSGQKRPVIITSQFETNVYDVSSERPRSKHPTLLDILTVDDPVVANCLVDQRRVESILVIRNTEEAWRVMKTNPFKVNEAFTQSGDQIFCRPTFRHYSCSVDRAKLLTSSVEDDINECRGDIARLEGEHRQALARVATADKETRSNQQQQHKCETQITRLRSQLSTVKLELDELRSIEDAEPVDVATLEEEVEHYDATLAELDERMGASKLVYEDAKQRKAKADEQFDSIDKQKKSIASKIETLKEELAHAENEIDLARSKRKHCAAKQAEQEKKCTDLTRQLDADQKQNEDDIAKAEQICERVSTRRKSHDIDTEIKQITKRLQEEEQLRGNEEEIMRNYHSSFETYKKIKTEIEQILNFLKALDTVMVQRQKRYFEFRRMIALRSRYFFIILLNNRNYSGKINFNHQKKSLELDVKTSAAQKDSTKDMRALSGGERSFATVCFILSLWDTMESPFRFLDEFDVFMDMVNRRVSMDMMMAVAKNRPYNQFIFLTPQDMSQMKTLTSIRILEMRKPERGQTTLAYERRAEEEMEEDE